MIQPPVSALELVLARLAVSHGWPVPGPGGPGIERHRAGPGRVFLELVQMQAAPISPDGVVSFGKLRGKQIMAHRAVDFVAEVSTGSEIRTSYTISVADRTIEKPAAHDAGSSSGSGSRTHGG